MRSDLDLLCGCYDLQQVKGGDLAAQYMDTKHVCIMNMSVYEHYKKEKKRTIMPCDSSLYDCNAREQAPQEKLVSGVMTSLICGSNTASWMGDTFGLDSSNISNSVLVTDSLK